MDKGKNFKRNPRGMRFFVLTSRLGPNTAFFSGYNTSGMICFVTTEEGPIEAETSGCQSKGPLLRGLRLRLLPLSRCHCLSL